MNTKLYTEKMNEAVEKMTAIRDLCAKEERAMNETETANFAELKKEYENMKNTMETFTDMPETRDMIEERAVETKETRSQEQIDIDNFAGMIRSFNAPEYRSNLDPTTGAGAIPTTVVNMIVHHIYEISPIIAKCQKFSMPGKVQIPVYTESGNSAITVAFVDDGTALTSKVGTITSITLDNYTAGALALVGKSLLNQSNLALTEFVVQRMAEAIARFMEDAILNGKTVSQSPARSVVGLSGISADMTITTTAATTISMDDLINCQNLITSSLDTDAIWVMSRGTFGKIKALKDAQNRYYMLPLEDQGVSGFRWSLLGRPVAISDSMPDMAASKVAVLYVNPSCVGLKNNDNTMTMQVLTERFADSHCYGVLAYTEFDANLIQPQGAARIVCHA